ncbi:MAG: DUF1732 domain-containing protein, partial [Bacteroidota bacterium]|nr:DUF1732 domain-containing protein [Bacteroidota bacterium]
RKAIDTGRTDRLDRIRLGLLERLQTISGDVQFDNNRLEQEIIYYSEKLDITEELVRLKAHVSHFMDAMSEEAAGKRLNFISQEMGREINTIGSKANDSSIQRIVVTMKDELEKIKEQVLNIL